MPALERLATPAPSPALDLTGEDLASTAGTWTALPCVGGTAFSAGGSHRGTDYMHARFSSPVVGRFLSPDAIDGLVTYPQSWNRFAYVRGNPLRYTDPTGNYAVKCEEGDKQCAEDADAFEKERQRILRKSKNPALLAAARAYGDPGEINGITVAFGVTGDGSDGFVTPGLDWAGEGKGMNLVGEVVIRSGLRGTRLRGVVAHEGQHLVDGAGFASSFSKDVSTWVTSMNLATPALEANAYRMTHAIFSAAGETFDAGCSGCRLGVGVSSPADVDLAIQRILTDPTGPYHDKLQNRQFGNWPEPKK